jgi:hypothetical protein
MPHPTDITFLRFNFSLNRVGTVEDEAVFGIWLNNVDHAVYEDPDLQAIAHGGYNAWSGNVDDSYWTTAVRLQSVVATEYKPDGTTMYEQNYVPDGVWSGSATSASMPWETALAISLYAYPRGTFIQNGKRQRGRYYLPPVAAVNLDPSNSGYFKDSQLGDFFTKQLNFLSDCGKDNLGVRVASPGVFSRVDEVCRPIVNVYVDAKFDSQRRRENREVAGYLTGVIDE